MTVIKFSIVPYDFDYNFKHTAVLHYWQYWNANFNELVKWCYENKCEILGMTVNIPDDQRVMLFILRWS